MCTPRKPLALTAALTLCGLLAACTPSVSASYDGGDPFAHPVVPGAPAAAEGDDLRDGALGAPLAQRGSGIVTIAYVPGTQFSPDLAEAFSIATGFTARLVAIESLEDLAETAADVVVGLDLVDIQAAQSSLTVAVPFELDYPQGVPVLHTAMAYGRDDVCVMLDAGWMSAGKRNAPNSFDALAAADAAPLLSIPDPSTQKSGQFFILGAVASLSEDLGTWAPWLRGSGALITSTDEALATWTAIDDEGESADEGADESADESAPPAQRTRPLLVAPMSASLDTLTTPGIEAKARPLTGTCVQRYLYAAQLPTATNTLGARSFLAWLAGAQGQSALAAAGAAYPLDIRSVENTAAHWFLSPLSDAVAVTPADAAGLADHVATWNAAVSN